MMSCRPLAGVRDKVSELESLKLRGDFSVKSTLRDSILRVVLCRQFRQNGWREILVRATDRQNRRRRIMNQILNEIPTRQLTEEVVQKGSTRLLSPTRPTAKQAQATSLRAK